MPDDPTDRAAIDKLVRAFFGLFSNRAGARPALGRIHELFVPQGLLVKCSVDEPLVSTLGEFIAPREVILTNGTLTDFDEEETAASTIVIGDCAQRLSAYRKSGVLEGQPFSRQGIKTFQFIRTGTGWKILSVAWDDEREGFAPADVFLDPPFIIPA